MLAESPLIAFLATTQPERARAFYQDALGLTLLADEPVALVFDAGGTALRISKVPAVAPAPYTVLGWQVDDIAAVVANLATHGVTLQRYENMAQDAAGIATLAGAKVAWFQDPDGNLLSLTQFD